MSQSKQQICVFLIHAHGDKKAVRKLCNCITRHNIKAWLDERELLPGQNWKREIRNAMLRSNIIIVCLSELFNKQGGYRYEELKIALEKASSLPDDEIFIIPARLENCDTPDALRHLHRVDLFEVDGYKKLMQALKKKVAST